MILNQAQYGTAEIIDLLISVFITIFGKFHAANIVAVIATSHKSSRNRLHFPHQLRKIEPWGSRFLAYSNEW